MYKPKLQQIYLYVEEVNKNFLVEYIFLLLVMSISLNVQFS